MRLLAHDLREATRTLRKEPRFLLITSLTLALGIAAATSIFSVVNGVLLKPLPYPNADRLVNVWSTAPALGYPQFPLSPDLFLFFKKHNAVFEDMALFQNRRANITESGPPEVIAASVATHSYFTTLGIAFSLGRGYGAHEDRHDGPGVAVISHRLWARRYGPIGHWSDAQSGSMAPRPRSSASRPHGSIGKGRPTFGCRRGSTLRTRPPAPSAGTRPRG